MVRRPPGATRTAPLFPYPPLCQSIDTNAIAGARLEATQVALGGIREAADEFFGALISAPDGPTGALTLRQHAMEGLKRSEEHTSELQSLMRISYAVFCLKKKKHKKNIAVYIKI